MMSFSYITKLKRRTLTQSRVFHDEGLATCLRFVSQKERLPVINYLTISYVTCRTTRVDWPVTEQLSAWGGPDPREGFHCFCCPNETSSPPLSASDTLTIVKNGLEMRKLQPLTIKGVQELKKKKTIDHYKG
jgi:hypothetical protein